MQTISAEYLKEQQLLHRNPNYGVASLKFAPVVADIIKQQKIKTVTDYGAGKKRLKEALDQLGAADYEYQPYDPAFPAYGSAQPAELVCCIDVLEHIEPDRLENVLDQLSQLVQRLGFFTIHMGPAEKVLSDGRNAHLIQKSTSWWLQRLCKYFDVNFLQLHREMGRGFMVVVQPLGKQ